MPTRIVSDLHSEVDALRQEVGRHDTLLLLGDLINIIDYSAMDGILVEVFGADAVSSVVDLRAQGRFDEARALMRRHREGRDEEVSARFQKLVRRAYRNVAAALPERTYFILGNVDSPAMVDELIRPGVEPADGKVFEIEGLRVGFAGGGLPTPLRVAGEIPEEEYDAKLAGLGDVDVVCSHVPPDIPELTYDTRARRHERGSARLVEYIHQVQPQQVFFGHIHQPLVSSMHVGRTLLVNVGYFRRTKRAITLVP